MEVSAGADWSAGLHAVCVIDAKGAVLDRFEPGHDRERLAGLVARLKRSGPPGGVPDAIKRPASLLVDHLAEAGFAVVPIHPNVVKACRGMVLTTTAPALVAASQQATKAGVLAERISTRFPGRTP